MPHRIEGATRRRPASKALDEVPGVIDVSPGAEGENDLTLLPVGQLERHLKRGTWVQTGPHLSRQPRPGQRGRTAPRAVTSQEFSPVAA